MKAGICKFLTGDAQDNKTFQFENMNLVFLDPVGGQSGNKYWMDDYVDADTWTAEDLYKKFFGWIGGKLHVTEVYARSAQMIPLWVAFGLKDFHPSSRFLYEHKSYGQKAYVNHQRFTLGFRHSSMMRGYTGEGRDKNPYYEHYPLGQGPSWLMINYLNDLITGKHHDISNKTSADDWADIFNGADAAALNRIKVEDSKAYGIIATHFKDRYKERKNKDGTKVSLMDLLGEKRGGQDVADLLEGAIEAVPDDDND